MNIVIRFLLALALISSRHASAYEDVDFRFVAGSVVYLRSAPDEASEVVARVPIATKVTVESETGPWCAVRVPPNALAPIEHNGYISCALLRRHAYSNSEIWGAVASSSQRVTRDPSWGKVTSDDWRARALATERAFWYSPSLRWLLGFDTAQRTIAQMQGHQDPAHAAAMTVWPLRRMFEIGFSTSSFAQLPLIAIDMSRYDPVLNTALDSLKERYPKIEGTTSFFAKNHEVAGFVGAPFLSFELEESVIRAKTDRVDVLADWALTNLPLGVQARFPKRRGATRDTGSTEQQLLPMNLTFTGLTVHGLSEYGLTHVDLSGLAIGGGMESTSDCEDPGFNVLLKGTTASPPPVLFLMSSRQFDPDVRAVREPTSPNMLGRQALAQIWSVDFDKDEIPDVLLIVSGGRLEKQKVVAGPGPLTPGFLYSAVLLANVGGQWGYLSTLQQWECRNNVPIHYPH